MHDVNKVHCKVNGVCFWKLDCELERFIWTMKIKGEVCRNSIIVYPDFVSSHFHSFLKIK